MEACLDLELEPVEPSRVRRLMRRAVDLACEVLGDASDVTYEARLAELTAQGAWLCCDEPFAIGSGLVVMFCLPGHDAAISLFAKVERVGDGSRPGVALSFTGISESERAVVARALVGVPPPFRPRRAS